MNSPKRLASALAFASAAAFSTTAYAQTGISTLDRADSVLQSGDHHERDRDSHNRKSAIVGMWITTYYIGPFKGPDTPRFDLAIQQFSSDGIELMSSSGADPKLGNICLGAWKDLGHNTFKLRHIGWSFTLDGISDGSGHINVSFTVSEDRKTYKGTYTFEFIDPAGNSVPEFSAEGDVLATSFEVDGPDGAPQVMGKALTVKSFSSGGIAKRRSC